MQRVRNGLATMGQRLIAKASGFAMYLGISERTVQRIMKDEELLVENARRNAIVRGGDPMKAAASVRAMMARPVARGGVDAGLWFFAFAPRYLQDASELKRAVDGIPTWYRAVEIARSWHVSTKTLHRHARLPYAQSGDLSAVRINRTLLFRLSEIADRYYRRRPPVHPQTEFLTKNAKGDFPST